VKDPHEKKRGREAQKSISKDSSSKGQTKGNHSRNANDRKRHPERKKDATAEVLGREEGITVTASPGSHWRARRFSYGEEVQKQLPKPKTDAGLENSNRNPIKSNGLHGFAKKGEISQTRVGWRERTDSIRISQTVLGIKQRQKALAPGEMG